MARLAGTEAPALFWARRTQPCCDWWLIPFQPCDLPHVVAGVDPVELAPLMRAQRAEDEVICQLARAEMPLAFRQYPVHVRDMNRDVAQNLIQREAPGHGILGRSATGRQVSEPNHDAHGETLRKGRAAGGGLAPVQAFLQVWDRRLVRAVQVLEDLGGGPLPFWVARQPGCIHAADGFGDGILHALQVGVHGRFPSA